MDNQRPAFERDLLATLGARLSRLRLDRNLSQAQAAREAGVSKRTLERIEAGHSTQVANLVRVLRAYGLLANLDVLVPPPLPSPIEQLRALQARRHGQRRRAGTRARGVPSSQPWSWGDEPPADDAAHSRGERP